MSRPDSDPAPAPAEPRARSVLQWAVRGSLLLAWFLAISCLPDPRPLSAPDWSVRGMRALIGLSEPAARGMQLRIRRGMAGEDLLPDFQGLPEGISDARFRSEFGGLGGEGTRNINEEITRRLAKSPGLRSTSDGSY